MKNRESDDQSLESEKAELFELAENRFGEGYFDRLDELTRSYLEEEKPVNCTLTTNYEGAFYAYAE